MIILLLYILYFQQQHYYSLDEKPDQRVMFFWFPRYRCGYNRQRDTTTAVAALSRSEKYSSTTRITTETNHRSNTGNTSQNK